MLDMHDIQSESLLVLQVEHKGSGISIGNHTVLSSIVGIIYLSNNLRRFIIILSILTFRTLLLPRAAPARQIYIKSKLSKIMLLG